MPAQRRDILQIVIKEKNTSERNRNKRGIPFFPIALNGFFSLSFEKSVIVLDY